MFDISAKIPHTFCIFYNEDRKMYHIWQTSQEKPTQHVTVTNAFSKAAYALSGKDSAQSGSSTTFLRILSSTDRSEWAVSYEELNGANKEDLQEYYEMFSKMYEDEGYTCITRAPKARVRTGLYSGQKWVTRKLENMTYKQVKETSLKMLEDCFVDSDTAQLLSSKVAAMSLKMDSEIENISQLWGYVFHNYSEKGNMNNV